MWTNAFLANRKQRFLLDGVSSKDLEVFCGVPQGSVVGPCFFLLYINDLRPDSLNADVTIAHSELDSRILQNDLDKPAQWEKMWDTNFHPDKS